MPKRISAVDRMEQRRRLYRLLTRRQWNALTTLGPRPQDFKGSKRVALLSPQNAITWVIVSHSFLQLSG